MRQISDRNMRYNFYDYNTRVWHWIDPDFMASGASVYAERSGFGNLQVEPGSGVAMVVAHTGTGISLHPVLARDYEPGAGIFEFGSGPDGFSSPVLATGGNGWAHIALFDNENRGGVWYSRCTTWCEFEPPRIISEPGFPSFNIAASSVSEKVVIVWVDSFGGDSIYYLLSTDGGTTWSDTISLTPPPGYGGDTITSFSKLGPFPYFDRSDRLHFVVDVLPVVNDTARVVRAGIWHWCETNYRGGLYVAWEEFDSTNVEPLTNLLRANIWLAGSSDNGQTWRG